MREKYTLSYRHSSSVVYAADIKLSYSPYTTILSIKKKPKLPEHMKLLAQGICIALNNGNLKIKDTTTDGK